MPLTRHFRGVARLLRPRPRTRTLVDAQPPQKVPYQRRARRGPTIPVPPEAAPSMRLLALHWRRPRKAVSITRQRFHCDPTLHRLRRPYRRFHRWGFHLNGIHATGHRFGETAFMGRVPKSVTRQRQYSCTADPLTKICGSLCAICGELPHERGEETVRTAAFLRRGVVARRGRPQRRAPGRRGRTGALLGEGFYLPG